MGGVDGEVSGVTGWEITVPRWGSAPLSGRLLLLLLLLFCCAFIVVHWGSGEGWG